jgi:hypothetical protein
MKQEHTLRQDLDLAELLVLAPGADQVSDQIASGRAPVIVHDRAHVARHLLDGLAESSDGLHVAERPDREIQRDGVDPALEALGVAARHAQQLGDHHRRQPQREVGHQVHLPASPRRVDQPVGEHLDPLP